MSSICIELLSLSLTAFKAPVSLLLTSVVLPRLLATKVAESLSIDDNLLIISMFIDTGGEARLSVNT